MSDHHPDPRNYLSDPLDDIVLKAFVAKRGIISFLRESNAIEGIHRDPTDAELSAALHFLQLAQISVAALCKLQEVFAPGKPLRTERGMDVRIGNAIPPRGGPDILKQLETLLRDINEGLDPWSAHCRFEHIHPFMDGNGRTGRALWAWMMGSNFAMPFLQRFYYQTLSATESK